MNPKQTQKTKRILVVFDNASEKSYILKNHEEHGLKLVGELFECESCKSVGELRLWNDFVRSLYRMPFLFSFSFAVEVGGRERCP